jgi:hypothetical protein
MVLNLVLGGRERLGMKGIRVLFLVGALAPAASQTRPHEQVEHGHVTLLDGMAHAYRILRLEPAAFSQVPKAVRKELERRKCLIPQTFAAKGAENVISGELRKKGVKDWVVLCSQEGYSTLLVFWNGSGRSVAELERRKDLDMMQTLVSSGGLEYSRSITTARPKDILAYGRNSRAGPFDHDGIDDGFLGKGSSLLYFRDGKWERLEGAD